MNAIQVCFLLRESQVAEFGNRMAALMKRIERAGLDGVVVGDHVSFNGGQGTDGLIQAAALLAAHDRLTVKTGIYLLPLRHPVAIARQLATISQIAPGRLVFGVGVGGEDPHEYEVCEVPHKERGARADEGLTLLKRLLAGGPVTHHGRFFNVEEAEIVPAVPDLPLIVGGRSNAALRRAGRFAEGWIGVWISHRRFAEATATVEAEASAAGRAGVEWRHEHQGWCFFDRDRESAKARAAATLEHAYRVPFEKFSRYTPCGTPEDVAAALRPFFDGGCRTFNLVAEGPSLDYAIDCAGEVRGAMATW